MVTHEDLRNEGARINESTSGVLDLGVELDAGEMARCEERT